MIVEGGDGWVSSCQGLQKFVFYHCHPLSGWCWSCCCWSGHQCCCSGSSPALTLLLFHLTTLPGLIVGFPPFGVSSLLLCMAFVQTEIVDGASSSSSGKGSGFGSAVPGGTSWGTTAAGGVDIYSVVAQRVTVMDRWRRILRGRHQNTRCDIPRRAEEMASAR